MDRAASELRVLTPRPKVLVINDESVVGLSCKRVLESDGCEVEYCQDPREGLWAATSGDFDIILLDLLMPGIDGLEILRQVKNAGVSSEVVVITGYATVESAAEAMKLGAADYFGQPFSPDQLRMVVRRVCERTALIRENTALRRELELDQGFEGILGGSAAMEHAFQIIKRVALDDAPVLVAGESGAGKKTVVRAIHRLSRRKERPLLGCDCTGLAAPVVESELFGHIKGALSWAIVTKRGLIETADHGTLFLDEVANLSLEAQAKLLRVLETRRVCRIGDTIEREVNVRLLAATNRDLADMVAEGTFREDLYYHLSAASVYLPPLRQREGDVPRLAAAFLAQTRRKHQLQVKGFTPEAMCQLERYHWPGNVRELRNVVERMAILCDADQIDLRHLPAEIRQATAPPTAAGLPQTWEEFKKLKQQVRDAAVQDLERRFLIEAMERAGGNITRAAERVGIQRTNFHALMRKYDLTSGTEP